MADNLPFGEVRPQARPVNAFIQPGQFQTGGVARPALLDQPAGLTSVRRASPGNVAGFNSFEQLADSLGPFLKASASLGQTAVVQYAKSQIDAGFYDELKNQRARAAQSLQLQAEDGAMEAGAQISALKKRDPEAAYLLNESNPFKLVGRRRALSILAKGEIDNIFEADLTSNAARLSSLAPGSPELVQRKVQLSQSVLTKYGLTGDEPEAVTYFNPGLNKAWDSYTSKHATLYSQQLKSSTIATATASMGQMLIEYAENGITFNGEVIDKANPAWIQLAGQLLTGELDKQLAMIGGVDRATALKEIREQLVGTYGRVPVLADALGMVRSGVPGSANRPVWGAAAPLEMLELRNRGNGAVLTQHENQQKGLEIQLDQIWQQGVGSMSESHPEYLQRLAEFRGTATGMGLRDVDGYLRRKVEAQRSVNSIIYAPDPFLEEDFGLTLDAKPNATFADPDEVQKLRLQAKAFAAGMPTRELQRSTYADLLKRIDKRAEEAGKITPGLQKAIDKAVLQDLGLPLIKPLVDAGKGKMNIFQTMLAQGQGVEAAAGTLGNAEVTAYTIRLNNLFLRNAETAIDAWRVKNPGATLTETTRNVLISGAIADTRKSQAYADAYKQLTGKKPGEVGAEIKGPGEKNEGKPGPNVRGVTRSAASSLPDTTARRYAVQPVLDGKWLREELVRYNQGKPASAELYELAKRGKTSTHRFMLEQLRFYPQLDPSGDIRRILRDEVRKSRQGNQISAANYEAVVGRAPFNPLAPGGWLMNILTPPAAAATMPPQAPAASQQRGGYTGGVAPVGIRESINTAAAQLGIRPVDLAAVISLETGGTFDKDIKGGEGGNYRGLIQFGRNEQRTYGYKPGMTFEQQVLGPVVRYLKARGVKPGHGVKEIYAAILTGNVANIAKGGLDWKDSFGTSVSKALPSLTKGGHYKNAVQFLGLYY